MFYTYVLYSQEYNKTYVGYTSNLEDRLLAHNHPHNNGWTKSFIPWKILFYETFDTKQEAMKREKELKSGKGRDFIANLLRNI